MKSNLQTALFGDAFQSAKINKKQFLEKMDSLIPWQDWVSIISPIYYEGKVGQKPYPIELMLPQAVMVLPYFRCKVNSSVLLRKIFPSMLSEFIVIITSKIIYDL